MARENHLHNVTRPPKEEGIVLILVMLLILILSVSSMAFLLMGSYEGDLVREWVESNEAFYLAETGIEQALWRLRDEEEGDWDWENWPPPTHPDWLDSSGGNGEDFWLLWNGTLGDGKNYQVQLEKGIIQSKIVSTGSVTFDRVIQLEVASAFDYGLFSHGQTEFQNDEFTVTGINNNGYVYVYSDDGTNPITDPSSLLVADKVTGNFQDGPGNFLYLPQEISLPELWKAKFKAHIDDNPSPTTVMYDNDSGEQNLEAGALLHNKTRGNSRIIQSFTIDTNIITTESSVDNWTDDDEIMVERIDLYESNWSALQVLLDQLNNEMYGSTFPDAVYKPDGFTSSQSFSDALFTYTPTVQFGGATTFSGNVKIDGNAIFGRLHTFIGIPSFSGETTISGDMVVNGNAYFFNKVNITGYLYVTGFLYIRDKAFYSCTCEGIIINEASSGSHGVTIANGGGLFIPNGTFVTDKTVSDGDLGIRGFCYVDDDITVTNIIDESLIIDILPMSPELALYIRNGSLLVGQNLWGKGKIIVSQNTTIGGDLLAPDGNSPFYVASGGTLNITGNLGTVMNPFCGLVYTGGDTSIGSSTNINGGSIITGGFSTPLSGGSILYKDLKHQLIDLGFGNKDFVCPVLWQEGN